MTSPTTDDDRNSRPPVEAGLSTSLREGFLVAEKYGLIEPLGTGSMGAVWKATHVMLGHTVAIKFLHASVEAYPEGRGRFEREAKLSARLGEASRHICRVSDFGVIGSGTPFVVLELLQGEELSVRLRRDKQLSVPLIVEIVTQLCRALQVAHDAGVIHRDLKPANVFLCNPEDGQEVFVKLLDFGVAKAALEHEDTQATRAGTIFGTPGYMSPEQIVGDAELDPRSDLWSVAVMAYRMAVGRTPFGSGGLTELGLRILSTNPPTPSGVRPDLPRGFDGWLRKALAKRREDRFASATELASALALAMGTSASAPSAQERPVFGDRISGVEDPTTYKAVYRSEVVPPPARARNRYLVPIAIGGSALTIAGALLLLTGGKSGDRASAQPTASTVVAPLPSLGPPAAEERPAPSNLGAAPAGGGATDPIAAADPVVAPDPSPASSATPPVAPARRNVAAPRTVRPPTGAGAVAKRAGELWNKKDEL